MVYSRKKSESTNHSREKDKVGVHRGKPVRNMQDAPRHKSPHPLKEKDLSSQAMSKISVSEKSVDAKRVVKNKGSRAARVKSVPVDESGLLEAFFKHTVTPLVILDRDYNFIRVNEAYARACHRDASAFPGHNHFEFYPDEENETIFREVVSTKTPHTAVAKPFIFPDHPEWGTTYWNWTLVPLLDKSGEVCFLVFSLEDVTASISVERQLRLTKEKLENTLESISDGFFTLDRRWRFTYLNQEAARLWKIPRQNLIGKSIWEVFPKDIDTLFRENYHQAVNEKIPVHFEALFPLKNIWVEFRAYPSEDGLSVYFLDIDKRKQAETRSKAVSDLLKLFSGATSRKEYLDSAAKLIRVWTGCCCIGLGVLDKEGNIPYESIAGFDPEFGEPEAIVSIKHLQYACLRIMLGEKRTYLRADMTPFGSFRSDNTFEFADSLSEREGAEFRSLCLKTGLKSIAIIPVRHNGSVVGAIHLADKREGMVPIERVEFIESISALLGEAIHRFNLGEEMHENYFNQAAINMVLSTSLEDLPFEIFLKRTLNIVLSVPWLSSESGGCIQVVENNQDVLVMKAHQNLPESMRDSCSLVTFGTCVCGQAAEMQKTYFADHASERHDFCKIGMSPHCHYAVPIIYGGKTLGVINIYLHKWHNRERKQEYFLETIANTLAGIIVRKQSEEQLRSSRRQLRQLNAHLQSVREKERTEIAREIHDEFGTILTALKIDLSWLEKKLPQGQRQLADKTKNSLDLINAAIKAVQRISSELRPGILDHLGLASAVEWHVKEFGSRTGLACDISVDMGDSELDRDLSTTIFRILQEALTNVARHSEATEVSVALKEKGGMLNLMVSDNGKGILEEQLLAQDSFGLMGIKERVKHWSGNLTIGGGPGKGTTISVNIPLETRRDR